MTSGRSNLRLLTTLDGAGVQAVVSDSSVNANAKLLADPVLSVRFTRDGAYLLSSTKEKRLIHLWNPQRGTHVAAFRGSRKEVRSVDVEPSNAGFVSSGGDSDVLKWDVECGKIVSKYRGHDRDVNAVRYDGTNSAVFASGGSDQSVRLWDARTKHSSCIQVLDRSHFKDSVMSVDWVGSTLVTGCVDGCVRTFDVRRATVVVDDVGDPVTHVHSSDRYVLAACVGGSIKLVDRAEDGRLLREYLGHAQEGQSKLTAVMSTDERCVFSGSEDGHICVWDTVRGDESLYKVRGHDGVVSSVDASPDGTKLASCGLDGVVRCFTVDTAGG